MAFLKGDDTHDDREIGDKYLALRGRLVSEFTTEQMLGKNVGEEGDPYDQQVAQYVR